MLKQVLITGACMTLSLATPLMSNEGEEKKPPMDEVLTEGRQELMRDLKQNFCNEAKPLIEEEILANSDVEIIKITEENCEAHESYYAQSCAEGKCPSEMVERLRAEKRAEREREEANRGKNSIETSSEKQLLV